MSFSYFQRQKMRLGKSADTDEDETVRGDSCIQKWNPNNYAHY